MRKPETGRKPSTKVGHYQTQCWKMGKNWCEHAGIMFRSQMIVAGVVWLTVVKFLRVQLFPSKMASVSENWAVPSRPATTLKEMQVSEAKIGRIVHTQTLGLILCQSELYGESTKSHLVWHLVGSFPEATVGGICKSAGTNFSGPIRPRLHFPHCEAGRWLYHTDAPGRPLKLDGYMNAKVYWEKPWRETWVTLSESRRL